jgi:5-(carboxyamino)imidazole ribonucleotide synthase
VGVIEPGKTIGLLGGGQLGRMFAIAARRMGYRVHALDPTPDCPAGQVADVEINARYDDLAAAEAFAAKVDVVTFEFENVPAGTLAAIERICPVRPSPFVLETTRHRLREKDFLSSRGFPVAPYRAVRSLADLQHAAAALGLPGILKTAEFGYDGKGQAKLERPEQLASAWSSLGADVGVLEGFVRFDRELSVIVARSVTGQTRCFEPFENVHRRHILDVTTCPATGSPTLLRRAGELAVTIAEALGLVGLLCVEMFAVGDEPIVNELAPRPHNSGHLTIDASATCQFEQQLRAVCGLPLGETTLRRPAAMANLLGDEWAGGEPRWARALAIPGVKLHLYGKHDPRPGRKMGHLTATADTAAEARSRVLAAREALKAER